MTVTSCSHRLIKYSNPQAAQAFTAISTEANLIIVQPKIPLSQKMSPLAFRSLSCVKQISSRNIPFKNIIRLKMSKPSSCIDTQSVLNRIFLSGVDAVRAKTIFNGQRKFIQLIETGNNKQTKLRIVLDDSCNQKYIDVEEDKQWHLVGFGKAVFGMAVEIDKVLGERLVSGILSVPLGTGRQFNDVKLSERIQVYEGAENNLPDEAAKTTARRIKAFVETLGPTDVLIVLISGGGSALLPLPRPEITLQQKCDIIKRLASSGADINDINRVRIDISDIKGGKLAEMAKDCHRVISLIISDIINNPLHLIASGPTVPKADCEEVTSKSVLEKYDIWPTLPTKIQNIFSENTPQRSTSPSNLVNIIVASNESAVEAALKQASSNGLAAICISTEIEGNISDLSDAYSSLAKAIKLLRSKETSKEDFSKTLGNLQKLLRFRKDFHEKLLEALNHPNDICLVGGGESTVKITGKGAGGRNQELALRFSLKCHQTGLSDVTLLSAGTDGIDGNSSTNP